MLPNHANHQHYSETNSKFLADLLCYSCKGHDWTIDKRLYIDRQHEIYVQRNGTLSLSCNCCDKDTLDFMVKEAAKLNNSNTIEIASGIGVPFYGFLLECSKCGSEEFCGIQTTRHC